MAITAHKTDIRYSQKGLFPGNVLDVMRHIKTAIELKNANAKNTEI